MDDAIRSKLNDTVDEVKNMVNNFITDEKVEHLKNEMTEAAGKARTSLEKQIREQPLASLAAALAVGFVLAKIIRR